MSAAAVRAGPPRLRTMLLRTVVGVTMGALLIALFIRLVDVTTVLHRLAHLRIVPALLCGAMFLGAYVVRALRWRTLLFPDRPSVSRVVAIYQVATFLNWLLPVRGGELAKCLLLRRTDGVPVSRSLATVSLDKGMDLLPAAVLLGLLPFVHLRLSQSLWALLLTALTVVALAATGIVLAAWKPERALAMLQRPVAAVLPQRVGDRIEPFLSRFLDTLTGLVRHPKVLLVACCYTVVAVGLDAAFCLLAFRAVGLNVAFPVILYGYTLFNLAFILPTPPGQVGSNELVGLLIFSGMFGLGRAGVGAMFLFSHPWTAMLMTTSGMLCLSGMGLSLRSTMRLAAARQEWQDA